MKWYFYRSEIDRLNPKELKTLHRQTIRIVFSILAVLAAVSILATWEFIPNYYQYAVLIGGILLWPWIRNAAYMARKLQ